MTRSLPALMNSGAGPSAWLVCFKVDRKNGRLIPCVARIRDVSCPMHHYDFEYFAVTATADEARELAQKLNNDSSSPPGV